jgi:transcriptional regulator with XRE-family HTH domain
MASGGGDAEGGRRSISDRINDVIDAVELRDGQKYSGRWIARRSTELGYPLTPANLSHIRLGRTQSPTFRVIEGIAKALGVDVRAFLSDSPGVTEAGEALVRFRSFDTGALNDRGRQAFDAVARSLLADFERQDEFRAPDDSTGGQ